MSKCPKCDKECYFDDYDCEYCGEKFWTSVEAYEKNLKKTGGKVDRQEEYKKQIDPENDETMICPNCKKETIVSTRKRTFAGMVEKKYVCDHCDHFLGGDPKEMRNTGILEIFGGLLSLGVSILIGVGGIAGKAFGIVAIILIGDGLKRLPAASKALKKDKNRK